MISPADRRNAVKLIRVANEAGASLRKACQELQISLRTYQRWCQGGDVKVDGRPQAPRSAPANKLTLKEREEILAVCNQEAYQSLPPTQIVPLLADDGVYLASESSFYRVLKAADQLHHRGKAQAPAVVSKPAAHCATAANQLWSWDITFLASTVVGLFYRLYLVMDIYSRKIVGWEIHENESASHAAQLIRKACLAEGVSERGLVLHSDNGSPMKGATMLATLQRLGVVPSFSRPSVSNDNPYSESLFGTMKVSAPESASIVLARADEDCLLLAHTGEEDDRANPAGRTRRLLAETDRSLAGIGAIADGLLRGERSEVLPVCLLAAQVSASR
jgi:transposase InsO family protein